MIHLATFSSLSDPLPLESVISESEHLPVPVVAVRVQQETRGVLQIQLCAIFLVRTDQDEVV